MALNKTMTETDDLYNCEQCLDSSAVSESMLFFVLRKELFYIIYVELVRKY